GAAVAGDQVGLAGQLVRRPVAEGAAVQLVGPRLGHAADDAAHGATELGRVAAARHRHLVHELERQVRAAAGAGGVGVDVAELGAGDVEAVDDVRVLEAGRAADRHAAGAIDESAGRLLDDVAE